MMTLTDLEKQVKLNKEKKEKEAEERRKKNEEVLKQYRINRGSGGSNPGPKKPS